LRTLVYAAARPGNLADFAPQQHARLAWGLSSAARLGAFEDAFDGDGRLGFGTQDESANAALETSFKVLASKAAALDLALLRPREVANLAWAFATVAARSADRNTATASSAEYDSSAAVPPRGVSAHLGMSFEVLLLEKKLSKALIDRLGDPRVEFYKPQELSSLAWAFAKLYRLRGGDVEAHVSQALSAVSSASANQLALFKPQELASLVWAFAAARHSGCLEGLAEEAASRAGALKPRELANVVWAFATATNTVRRQRGAVPRREPPHFALLQGQRALVAAVAARLVPKRGDDVLGGGASAFMGGVSALNAQELSNVAWAYATLFSGGEVELKSGVDAWKTRRQ